MADSTAQMYSSLFSSSISSQSTMILPPVHSIPFVSMYHKDTYVLFVLVLTLNTIGTYGIL